MPSPTAAPLNLHLFDAAVNTQQGKRPYQEDEVAVSNAYIPIYLFMYICIYLIFTF